MDLQLIQKKIYEIRGFRVMTDFDLADFYHEDTKRMKEKVRRNIIRFPAPDFMFELTTEEYKVLRTQIASFNIERKKFAKYPPFVFTDLGIAMLSSVLNTDKAIEINISIMRAFALLRELTIGYTELKRKLEEFQLDTTLQIAEIFDIINAMAAKQNIIDKPRKQIGFKSDNDNNNDPIQ